MIGLAALALFLLAAPAHADDEPEIAVEASASEIYIGESVDYVVEIRNVKNPVAAGPVGGAQGFRRRRRRRRVAQSIVDVHHQRPGHPAEQLRSRLPVPPDAEANGQAGDPGAVRDDRRQDRSRAALCR